MKARGSLAALALAAACLIGAASVRAAPEDLVPGVNTSPTSLPTTTSAYQRATRLEAAVLIEINRTRARSGLHGLRLSKPLGKAAAFHSREMADFGYFDHVSPNGLSFSDRIGRFYLRKPGGRYWAVGENMVWSTRLSPAEVVASWLVSPVHRATLLSRLWREVGLGAISARAAPGIFGGVDVKILTADFGTRR